MSLEIVYLINIGVGLLIGGLAIPLILEKIKPNMWYGFKTKKTLSDEKIWYPANKCKIRYKTATHSGNKLPPFRVKPATHSG
ncbi:MAG: SdpI family protein, partial [Spirochaetales bacterium]|nr:SdpI family protein [Spirochaetales bacterium]